MCRFGPIIGILIRAGLFFFFLLLLPHPRCRLRAHRAAEGPHGSTLYPPSPRHLYAMSIPGRCSAAHLADPIQERQKKLAYVKKRVITLLHRTKFWSRISVFLSEKGMKALKI